MSQAILHFAVGGTLTALLIALVPDVPYPRTLVLIGGGWAMIPDAAKLASHPALLALHDSPVADIFWFHRTLDHLDESDSVRLASVALVIFIVVTSLLERRSYRAPEVVRERGDGD
ncbi:hypothetical protein [Natronorubrum texcoconense]|uniref:LexA-binding, inner membrane-associated hydrolase n=1 Tax=Natronorubrum texcoconense TaxID=1095776 RepID=A0A1G9E8J0_9EURY|nr:hypothetical protein [Natronorubrum texcoconense]SDK72418.1 hypothetical protein SAMN04515672_3804 [Natronorubrum texcoconense]